MTNFFKISLAEAISRFYPKNRKKSSIVTHLKQIDLEIVMRKKVTPYTHY